MKLIVVTAKQSTSVNLNGLSGVATVKRMKLRYTVGSQL